MTNGINPFKYNLASAGFGGMNGNWSNMVGLNTSIPMAPTMDFSNFWNNNNNFSFNMSNIWGNNFTTPMMPNGLDFSNIWNNTSFSGVGSSTGSSSASSSSNDKKEMTIKERIEWQEAHKAEIEEAKKSIEEQEKIIKEAKNAEVAEDGTLQKKESKEDFKKIGFLGKLGRGLLKVGEGAIDCGFTMLGIESVLPPKVDFKKLGKAVGFAALTAAATCIPVVGPFVVPALITAGVAMGAGKVGHGLYTACTTDDPEKFDMATKGIGEGATIAALSVAGIRKAGGSGFISGFKNMFANAKTQSAAETFTFATAKAKFNTNIVKPVKDFKSAPSAQQKFQNELNQNVSNLDAKIADVNTKLASTTSEAERALLNQEKMMLEAQKNQITLTTTRQKWNQVGKENQTQTGLKKFADYQKQMESGSKVQVGTRADGSAIEMDATESNIKFLAELQKRNQGTVKDIQNLVNTRKSTMRRMLLSPKDGNAQSALNQYTGSNSFLGRTWGMIKPQRPQVTGNWWAKTRAYSGFAAKNTAKFGWKCFWTYPMKPYHWYQKMTRAGYTTGYTVEKTFFPKYEEGMLAGLLGVVGGMMGKDLVPDWMGGRETIYVGGEVQTDPTTGQQIQVPKAATKDDIKDMEKQLADMKDVKKNLDNGIVPTELAAAKKQAAQQSDAEALKALQQGLNLNA